MRIRKLLFLTFTLGAALVIAAFGSNGLKDLFTTALHPAEAAGGPPPARAGGLMVAGRAVGPITQTVMAIELVPAPEIPTRAPDAGGVFSNREGNTLTLQSFFVMTSTQGTAVFGGAFTAAAPGVPGMSGIPDMPAVPGQPGEGVQAGGMVFSGTTTFGEAGGQGELMLSAEGSAPEGVQSLTIVRQGELAQGDAVPPAPGEVSAAIAVGVAMPGQAASQKVVVTDATKIYHDVTPVIQVPPTAGTQTIQQMLEAGSLDDMSAPMMVTVWGHKDGEQLVADMIVYQNPFLK